MLIQNCTVLTFLMYNYTSRHLYLLYLPFLRIITLVVYQVLSYIGVKLSFRSHQSRRLGGIHHSGMYIVYCITLV